MGLSHGEWSNSGALVPPENLPPVSLNAEGDAVPGIVFFESESDGAATGTEGFVDYGKDGVGNIHIYWDNPYIGSNGFSVNTPDHIAARYGDFSGNDANVTIDIRRA